MQHRRRGLIWLSLLILLGLGFAHTETAAQGFRGPLGGEYNFGYFGGSWDRYLQSREEVINREGVCPTGGCVLKLNEVKVLPSRAHPGDTLSLTTSYTILTPEQKAIPVTVSREILFEGKPLGQTRTIDSLHFNGDWTQELDFTLPADARPGVYTLRTKVSTGYVDRQQDVNFEVY
jgi:hypothetical protein